MSCAGNRQSLQGRDSEEEGERRRKTEGRIRQREQKDTGKESERKEEERD